MKNKDPLTVTSMSLDGKVWGLVQAPLSHVKNLDGERLKFLQSQGLAWPSADIDKHMLRCVENQKIEQPYIP